jgi:hypothetical protein
MVDIYRRFRGVPYLHLHDGLREYRTQHPAKSQKTAIFIIDAVRISYFTNYCIPSVSKFCYFARLLTSRIIHVFVYNFSC